MQSNYLHTKLTFVACVLAFVVILLGAYTRLTNAGLSCPDWPHCYGYLTAPHTPEQIQKAGERYPLTPVNTTKAWTEMTHRYLAGTEGLFILSLSFLLLRKRELKNRLSTFIGLSLIVLLITQIFLGMLTVTALLKPVVVLGHLLTGLSLLCLLWCAYLTTCSRHKRILPALITKHSLTRLWLGVTLLIVATQIALGGWVSTHYAGLACIDFPYCNGQWLPSIHWDQLHTDLVSMHMLHRIGAFITALTIVSVSVVLFRYAALRKNAALLLLLVALQITLGIFNILWLRPVWLALIHHGVAILLLLTVMATLIKTYSHTQDLRHVKLTA